MNNAIATSSVTPTYSCETVEGSRFTHFLGSMGDGAFSSSQASFVRGTAHSAKFASRRYYELVGLCDFSSSQAGMLGVLCPDMISGSGFSTTVSKLSFLSGRSAIGGFIEGCGEVG